MNIKVYGRTTCAYCKMVKQFLDMKRHAYEYINLDETPEYAQGVYELSGVLTVPVTVITKSDGIKVPVIGYNVPSFIRALS